MNHILHRLWLRIQEPRKQTTVYFMVYLLTTTLGGAILLDPPRSLQGTMALPAVDDLIRRFLPFLAPDKE